MDETHSPSALRSGLALSRRKIRGSFLLGLLAGGIPFGIFLLRLGITDRWAGQFFLWLTPVAVLIAGFGAILAVDSGSTGFFWRAFVTAFSACVPVPTVVWTLLAWRARFQLLDFRNLPYAVILFALWTAVVTVLAWLLATVLTFLKHRRSPAQRTGAM